MKAVLTGGAGFIGSHIVDALLAEGVDVHVVDGRLQAVRCEHASIAADAAVVAAGIW